MGVFDRQIATAERMITAKGRLCTWRQYTTAPLPDPAKPHEGGEAVPSDTEVSILFLPEGRTASAFMQALTGTDIKVGQDYGLMPAYAFSPRVGDRIYDEAGTELLRTVSKVEPLAPNGDVILYTLRFEVAV